MLKHSAPGKSAHRKEVNLNAEYDLEVYVSDACSSCYSRGGLWELDNKRKFHCAITEKGMNFGITQKYLVLQLHILKMLMEFFPYRFLYILMVNSNKSAISY